MVGMKDGVKAHGLFNGPVGQRSPGLGMWPAACAQHYCYESNLKKAPAHLQSVGCRQKLWPCRNETVVSRSPQSRSGAGSTKWRPAGRGRALLQCTSRQGKGVSHSPSRFHSPRQSLEIMARGSGQVVHPGCAVAVPSQELQGAVRLAAQIACGLRSAGAQSSSW